MRPKSTPQEETCIRQPRVRFSVEAIHTHSPLQARGPHLSPCLPPLCGLIPVMPGMSELHEESEANLQDPREAESPVVGQFI